MKGLAIMTAAAALALTPGAAAAKKPLKAKDRAAAKVERTEKGEGSAQQRCRDERKGLGAAAFAAKYGKPRTKGSAKAKAKAARAAFGRCVSQTAQRLKEEREAEEAAAEEAELAAEEEALDAAELAEDEAEGVDQDPVDPYDDDREKPESDDGGKHPPGHAAKDPDGDDDEPVVGLGDDVDLD